MPTTLALIAALLLLAPPIAHVQDSRAALDTVARAMGADSVKSLEYTGSDRLLPLHGRIVPLADLHRASGRVP